MTVSQKIKSSIMREEKAADGQAGGEADKTQRLYFSDHTTITVLGVCDFISDMPLTVTTNSLPVMEAVSQHSNIRLCVPGGDFDQKSQAFWD